mgnify:CR=1 FL=1
MIETRRGIDMQPESLAALEAGTKTQTRRLVLVKVGAPVCPYGRPGDALYVRESYMVYATAVPSTTDQIAVAVRYKADGAIRAMTVTPEVGGKLVGRRGRWHPPRYMPRWVARWVLRLEDVRRERLNDINEADAQAEGVPRGVCTHPDCTPGGCASSRYRPEYATRWDQINRKRAPWSSNPEVWALTFAAGKLP